MSVDPAQPPHWETPSTTTPPPAPAPAPAPVAVTATAAPVGIDWPGVATTVVRDLVGAAFAGAAIYAGVFLKDPTAVAEFTGLAGIYLGLVVGQSVAK